MEVAREDGWREAGRISSPSPVEPGEISRGENTNGRTTTSLVQGRTTSLQIAGWIHRSNDGCLAAKSPLTVVYRRVDSVHAEQLMHTAKHVNED